jgi:hypothetical protein
VQAAELPAPPPDAPPGDDVHCPLCDYDLRGLTEPRCPECGYRFVWDDLTDPARRRHPYLFEHHPRRNTWSFVRTLLGGLRPRRFWSSVRPSQPSRPGRLVVYWLVTILLVPLAYAAAFATTCYRFAPQQNQQRASLFASATATFRFYQRYPQEQWPLDLKEHPSPQAYVDFVRPPPGSPAYLAYVLRNFYGQSFGRHLDAVLIYLAWPWLMFLTLMIFRASMRRAKVNTVHALRCSLYCCDAAPWLLALALWAVPPLVETLDLGRYIGYRDAVVSSVLFAGVTGWRLSAAYRNYLQFHRPAATAAAAQVIVLLVSWVYLMGRALEAR